MDVNGSSNTSKEPLFLVYVFFRLKKIVLLRTFHWKVIWEIQNVILWHFCENPLLKTLFVKVCVALLKNEKNKMYSYPLPPSTGGL